MSDCKISTPQGIINYTIIRRNGMKNIRLKITPQGQILVSANPLVANKTIEIFIVSKSDWIIHNKKQLLEKEKPPFQLENHAKATIFGKPLEIIIKQGAERFEETKTQLVITAENPENQAETERIFLNFLAGKCRNVLESFYKAYYPKINYLGVPPQIILRLLKSRWGSWDRRKSEMMFNFALCTVPVELAEYVVVHELVHLKIHGHGKDFYQLGEYLLPNFKALDRKLNNFHTDLWRGLAG